MEYKLSDFKIGLLIGFLIYLLGAVLTYLVHQLTGWSYGHAPPVSFLVIIITYIVGIIRSVFNKANMSLNYNKNRNKGELMVHLTILGLTFVLLLLEIFF
ncbi:hypothetical protein EGI31_24240 [Lacihabitans soyangensis]|uniref:Uncharacterized protein n=1 Tax=Lacihabitans soyangensis TaxID=869394 RepID=A0AAE3KVH3_9BACT|nr:hypothetical protein [Lacihabitans soyangensis]